MDHYEAFRRADSDEARLALWQAMTDDERAALQARAHLKAAAARAGQEIAERARQKAESEARYAELALARCDAFLAFLRAHGINPDSVTLAETADFLHPLFLPAECDDPERLPSAIIAEHKAREGRQ